MISKSTRKIQALALLTGGVFVLGAALQPTAAQADDNKSKLYKGGAAALGVLGAYWILEGKTVQGAAAAAGGYYAYKKGRDIENDDRYDDYWDRDRYDDRYDYRDRDRYDYRDRDRYDYRRDNDRYDYDYRRRDRDRDRDRIGNISDYILREGYRR
jgi:hypothetical protein